MPATPWPDAFVDACAATFRARGQARRANAQARAVRLRRAVEEAVSLVAARFGPTRIWLFGSLAWGEPHEGSDVDLLVEGLAAEAWSAATALVEEVVRAPVDLVRAEDAAPGLVARVRAEGRLLHGA
jgi:predicted nucleotidyltransferase